MAARLAAGMAGAVMLAYPLIAYVGLRLAAPAAVGVALIVLLAARAWLGRRSPLTLGHGPLLLVVVAAFAAVLVLDAEVGVKAYPLLVNFALAGLFGWSLLRPPSVVERLARLREPGLDDRIVPYGRNVTALWFGFLLANGAVAAWTAVAASPETWLLYNGFAAYIAMAAIFAGELAVRTLVRRRP